MDPSETAATTSIPWKKPGWLDAATSTATEAVSAAGCEVTGPLTEVKSWGRAHLATLPVRDGALWIKHAYRLPPGEEVVLATLSSRHPHHIPEVIATWPGGVAMREIPGTELGEQDSLETWCEAARTLANLCLAEEPHATEWIDLGVRDRRPEAFAKALDALLESPAVDTLAVPLRDSFRAARTRFLDCYAAGFDRPPTLIHQDSGCCNIHIHHGRATLFDWSDVVVGHPTYSCDRLLDQVPPERQPAVIEAFCEPLEMLREHFTAARRSNVLHEILRYHDELEYLPPSTETYTKLLASVQSQINVLMHHEAGR